MSRVLVTGASGGIGRAVARELAGRGDEVLLVARGAEALEAVRADLPGAGHQTLAFDVADPAAWEHALAGVEALDGVVAAAGALDPIGALGDYPPDAFWRTMEVNVRGTFLALHHGLARMRSGGAAVTFSGGGGTAPLPRYDAYATSKAAVVRLTENVATVARERGIAVNCVAPGFVATEIHDATLRAGPEAAGPEYYERTKRDLEQGGVPPGRAAALVALLLGPEGRAIHGKLISAQWDAWEDAAFRARLAAEPDLATLRRIDDHFFAATGR